GAGLGGVTIHLTGAGPDGDLDTADDVSFAPQVTDAAGGYDFTGLVAGLYRVDVDESTLPGGLVLTTANEPLEVTLASGENFDTADFGYDADPGTAGSLGDLVWWDQNSNGAYDSGELGLDGVGVSLEGDLDGDGIAELTGATVTATVGGQPGVYGFTNLPEGSYTVIVDQGSLPPGLNVPTYDKDGTGSAGEATVSLAAGANDDTVDFGYAGSGLIGDLVWLDGNGDGFQDFDEPGIGGVTVILLDAAGNPIASMVTGPDGSYLFTGLPDGLYGVRIDTSTLPGGVSPTYDYDGTDTPNEVLDIDLNAGDGGSSENLDIDFGYSASGSIGDLVWVDINGNGVQDGSEAGILGVVVYLYDASDNLITIAFTDGDGLYHFEHLLAGTYRVEVEPVTLPPGLQPSYDYDGIATPNSAIVVLGENEVNEDVDFGYNGNASIGDRLWLDLSADGVQDPGEPGLAGVTVELLDSGGAVLASAVTDGNGLYGFANLLAGTYTVRVDGSTLPAGVTATYDYDGIGTLNTAAVSVGEGESNDQVDFGYVGNASLGDLVWIDLDGDGLQGPGEDGIGGVTVNLFDAGGNLLASTVTDGAGVYGFGNLPGGSYTVAVDASTLPPGLNPSYDLDGVATPNSAVATVPAGGSNDQVDFGYNGNGSLGDLVWRDDNANGVQDGGEPGLAGIPVSLLNGSGTVIATTATDGNGLYGFGNLTAGTYTVVVDGAAVAAYEPTYDLDGIATANTATVALATGESNSAVDFGYRSAVVAGSIGDRVWLDSDGDGVQDAGEAGVVGATVDLLDETGTVIATTTTGADGLYSFPGLPAGIYTVVVDHQTTGQAVIPTYDLDGIDSPNRAQVALAEGEDRDDLDFGYTDQREICVDEAQKTGDTHAVWLPGIATELYFEPPAVFNELPDGTATLTGTAVDATNMARSFFVQVTFTGRTAVTPAGSPKKELDPSQYVENGGPIDTDTWYYYTGFTGTLVGDGDLSGAVIEIERVGPAFQVGYGANGKNLAYGASSWFHWTVVSQPTAGEPLPDGQGDFNVELIDCTTSSTCLPSLDFDTDAFGEPLAAGTVITDQWASLGIHVSSDDPVNHPLMIFDSAHPTGGDPDLGTPNEDFGGPGIGSGGGAGMQGENRYPLGNLLILSEDGDSSDPDDNAGGGVITFDFDQAVNVDSLTLVDVDGNENAMVFAFDGDGALVAQAGMLNLGDNSVQKVVLDAVGVRRLEVHFPGSGAIAEVVFCKEDEPPTPCGACDGKVTELTLQYTGTDTAKVEVYDKKGQVLIFSGDVAPGEEFTLHGFDNKGTLGPEIKVYVNDHFHTKIHTSCSQPIGPGLVAGDFLVVAGESRNGGALCPIDGGGDGGGGGEPECGACDGKVTELTLEYLGSSTAKVEVYDRRGNVLIFSGDVDPGEEFTLQGFDNKGTLGTEIKIYVNDHFHTKIHTSCSQPIGPGLIAGDFIVVEGASRNGGALCPLDGGGSTGGEEEPECAECDGKVTTLTLRHLRNCDAYVQVFDKRGDVLLYSGNVGPAGEFTVDGFDNQGTLGSEIKIYVNHHFQAKIHTSCSEPIGPGLIAGDFIVVEGESRNGGPLCSLGGDGDDDDDDDD
ncbi:MAG: carboxypeptidase regulatory-like domain-containing protein, partial [Acidobacteria bacterium]|nr:carboxypeptidase regulatory-like domain-containing protein [Acidobacteriota bacterium]